MVAVREESREVTLARKVVPEFLVNMKVMVKDHPSVIWGSSEQPPRRTSGSVVGHRRWGSSRSTSLVNFPPDNVEKLFSA